MRKILLMLAGIIVCLGHAHAQNECSSLGMNTITRTVTVAGTRHEVICADRATGKLHLPWLDPLPPLSGVLIASDYAPSSTCGIAEAITALGGAGVVWVTPTSTNCVMSAKVQVSTAGQHIKFIGGKRSTTLKISATFTGPLFEFSNGVSTLVQTSIEGLRVDGTGNNNPKVAVLASDVSQFAVLDSAAINWTDATAASKGFETRGREFIVEAGNNWHADQPIDIRPNPNSTIMLDTSYFGYGGYLNLVGTAGTTNPCINIAAAGGNATITHTRFSGIDCAGGKNLVYWVDPTNTFVFIDLYFGHMHWEQAATLTGYGFRIEKSGVQLRFEDVDTGGASNTANGFFLTGTAGKSLYRVTLANSTFAGAANNCITTDNTVYHLVFENFHCQVGSSVTLTGQQLIWGGSTTGGANRANAVYDSTAGLAGTPEYHGKLHSLSPSPATTGQINLANADKTCWMRSGGGGDHCHGEVQFARVAGCATAASLAAVCTTTVAWASGFADTSYTVTCVGAAITSGVPINGGLTSKTNTQVVFQTVSATAAAAQYTNIECVATHD